jgi:tetratricopeptide (TPR) repeat protein
MTLPRDDWDDDERRALAGFEKEFEQLRLRHRDDPPFELLRAADAEALPEPLQATLNAHLQQSAWSRALVAGGTGAEPSVDEHLERRLLSRIERSARPAAASWRWRSWIPALAAAAVLVVMVGVMRRGEPVRVEPQPPSPAPTPAASAPPAPVFLLPLDRADVKMTAQALVLRNDAGAPRFVDDIAPALKAYGAGDYVEANRLFAALQTRYPKAIEVVFYRAVAQLFLGDMTGAIESLQAARRLDADAFAPEIGWYLAVAYERAGDRRGAQTELAALCRQNSPFATRACEAASRLQAPNP